VSSDAWSFITPSSVILPKVFIQNGVCSICIKDAEEEIRRIVEAANADYFHRKGAQLEFRKETFKSWVQGDNVNNIII